MEIFLFLAAVVLFVALTPKPQIENARANTLGDFRFPTAKEGASVPYFCGTVRLRAPNTIWYGDFKAVPITKKVKTSLFSSKRVTVGYKYYVGIDLALSLGPGVVLKKMWAGKHVAWTGTQSVEGNIVINLPDLFGGDEKGGGISGTMTFYPGSFTQSRDAYLTSKCDANVPRYGGVSHLVFQQFYIGTSTTVQAFTFEASKLPNTLPGGNGVMPNGLDSNPLQIAYDLFTTKWGCMGIDVALIDTTSWQAAALTLYNEGLGMSLKLENANAGKTAIEEIMRVADGLIYQDPGTQKIIAKLLRNDYSIPALTVLDVTDIISVNNFSKTTWEATFNQVRVTFPSRAKDYEDSVAAAQDFANINFQGRIRSDELAFPGLAVSDTANKVAARSLAVRSVPLYKCELKCTRAAASFRPGDVFVFNWSPYSIVQMVMRVQSVELGDLTNGEVTLTVIQDVFAAATVVFGSPENTGWTAPNTVASQIGTRKVIEAPQLFYTLAGMSHGAAEGGLHVSARQPADASLAYYAEHTTDAWATVATGIANGQYTPCARLTAQYLSSAGGTSRYDATGFTVDSLKDNVPSILVAGATRPPSADGRGLLIMNGEVMAYHDYTDNGNGTYTIKGISRQMLDTLPETHASGSYVFFVDGQEGLSEALFADTAAVTTRLRDITASSVLSTASALTDAVTLDRRAFRPAPPAYLTLNSSRAPASVANGSVVTVGWRERNRNAASLIWYDDATQTPEASTTYRIRYSTNGGGSWTTETSTATGTSYSWTTPAVAGTYLVEIHAQRDGLLSRIGDSLSIVLT